jgi:hypothetical protein
MMESVNNSKNNTSSTDNSAIASPISKENFKLDTSSSIQNDSIVNKNDSFTVNESCILLNESFQIPLSSYQTNVIQIKKQQELMVIFIIAI